MGRDPRQVIDDVPCTSSTLTSSATRENTLAPTPVFVTSFGMLMSAREGDGCVEPLNVIMHREWTARSRGSPLQRSESSTSRVPVTSRYRGYSAPAYSSEQPYLLWPVIFSREAT
jgi:hypothetical protein